jgi:uncharacterized repeat protein (TIGR02543 family)
VNATTGGDTVNVGTTPGVDTGIVSVGGIACDPIGTQASCIAVSDPGTTYTITGLGTISITYAGGPIGPILLQAPASGDTDREAWLAANPTFNATANSNGGTCSGITSWQRIPYAAAFPGIFALPTSNQCTRSGYLLVGWATTANASNALYSAGDTFTMSDADVTLYAVWRPNGIEIVYDANVGLDTQCLTSNGTNLTTAAERRTTPTVVPASSAAAAQAPCTPPGHTLNGWSLTGAGPLTLVKGAALPASFTGTSQTLYAKWEPDRFDLSVQADSLIVNSAEPLRPLRICAGVSQLVTFTATKNGVAAAGQIIDVEIARTGAPPITQQKLTTDASGRVQVNFKLDRNYTPQVVSGSFANQVARLIFVERDSLQCVETITITGARTTVDGKPGIMVEGVTTGFAAGAVVKPYFRFPGETSYTESSARPVVDASGRFTWTRKTGKKLYAYMVSEDGSVQSNRVIIPAN